MNQFPRRNQPIIPNQCLPSRLNPFLPVRCKRQIRDARVSAIEGPFGFAVADYEASWGHFSFLLFLIWGGMGCILYIVCGIKFYIGF